MSKAFVINYELKTPGKDYQPLFSEIKKSSKWWHFLPSTWIINTEETPNQVYERLRWHMTKEDHILILEVRNNNQGWLPKEAWDWINANVPK